MASLSLSIFTLLSLALISNAKITEEQIRQICLRIRDPPFCFRTLRSDPRLDTSNIHTLAKTAIELAHNFGHKTHAEIESIIGITGDHKARETYQSCAENYKEAMAELVVAQNAFASGNYRRLRVESIRTRVQAIQCEENLEKTSETVSPIRDNNRDFGHLCNIIWSISTQLINGN